jgi:ribosomal protein L18
VLLFLLLLQRNRKGTNVDVATAVGKPVAEKALKVGIEVVTFDREVISRSY